MESSCLTIFILLALLLLLNVGHSHSHSFNTTMQTKCLKKERDALLEFKANLYNESCYNPYGADLKTWTVEGKNGDCCNWDRVECDERSGHVIGLSLDESCLSGSINSSSSIFKLDYLQRLDLGGNDFRQSKIPSAICNLSRLESLFLSDANFSGQIPLEILHLGNLSSLYLSRNQLTLKNPSLRDLTQSLIKLRVLDLRTVEISSSIPDSLFRLTSLTHLYLSSCELHGQIPASLGNLTKLKDIDLGNNQFTGEIFPQLVRLTKLWFVDLSYNKFSGQIPRTISHINNIAYLYLASNDFSGDIHLDVLFQIDSLLGLDLSYNKFFGQVPRTISHASNIKFLYLVSNDFSGDMHLDAFFQIDSLVDLDLSYNKISLVVNSSIAPRSKLLYLGLASLNLRRFPLFLQSQDSLQTLDLSCNDISGEIPQWFMDVSIQNLTFLNLSHNHLSGFEVDYPLLKWSVEYLDLSFSQLKGSLPIPSTNSSLSYYLVSNNQFSRELPTRICDFVNLFVLDISDNNLSSVVPQCMTNLVDFGNLSVLNLHNNNFSGSIPAIGRNLCNLEMIDMSYNQLEGPMPRDLKKCLYLEFLNLGNNKIIDDFPFWLGKLPALSVLILHSNKFHGIIETPLAAYKFPKLQIINLSNNNFTGRLPTQYFEGWSAMKVEVDKEDRIMSYASYEGLRGPDFYMEGRGGLYFYKVMLTEKGINLEYAKIPNSLIGIDLSSNNFIGEILKSIASLKGLRFLNLSSNMLMGSIPFNLNGLVNLESLDLSHNKLSGEIPQRLTDLTTLAFFDVSFNQLTGLIPLSKQFNTFENSSYQGNPGLCGIPLSRKCKNVIKAPPSSSFGEKQASGTWFEINWIIVSMGYISGFAFGVVMGIKCTRGCKRVKRVNTIKFVLN